MTDPPVRLAGTPELAEDCVDALSDVLRIVRLTGAVFLDAEFSEPWCVGEPSGVEVCVEHMPDAQHVVIYHLVTEGCCEASVPGGPAVSARGGDLIIIPGGEAHSLGSNLAHPAVPGGRLVVQRGPDEVPRVRYGGGGAATRMVCGYLACDSSLFDTVLAALPRIMLVNMREGPGAQWLTSSIRFSLSEASGQRAGAGTVLAKLSELMFVEAIRRHIESLPPEQTGWLAGLRDRFVGRALALMHEHPGRDWTVDELSGSVGLSRSSLAQRFADFLGQPPIQYLTRWRLTIAAQRLRNESTSLARIAAASGYESEAAFNRAFKRALGTTPAVWRRGDGNRGARKSRSTHQAR